MTDLIVKPIKQLTREELLYEPKVRAAWTIGNSISSIKQRNVTWKIGYVNFDSDNIEVGDCVFLSLARTKCDLLVVGIPTDLALRKIKKKFKFDTSERAFTLASLSVVDYIVPYEEENPALTLSAINPDIIFKGRISNEDVSWSINPSIKIETLYHPFQERKLGYSGKFFNI